MNPSNFNRGRVYSGLSSEERKLETSHGYPMTHYDSHGRPRDLRTHRAGWSGDGRVRRLQEAFEKSERIAYRRITQRLGNLDLTVIWPILCNVCHDIGIYLGAAAVGGGMIGGMAGTFIGGAGALPGALAGTALGLQIGGVLLNLLGLACVVEYMIDSIPKAARAYMRGIKEAWGPLPPGRGICFGNTPSGSAFIAADALADGHEIVIMALLTGIVAYLTRGKGDLGTLLAQVPQSAHLGPKMADWLRQNAAQMIRNPGLQKPIQSAGGGVENAAQSGAQSAAQSGAQSAAQSGAQSAAQSGARPPAGKAPKPADAAQAPIKEQTPAKKGVFGEATGDRYMLQKDFEKLSNGSKPTKIGDAPGEAGLDGVWKNAHPPPDYVITEMKYGSSKLGQTRDGRQMSDDWINGANTGFDRLVNAVGQTERLKILKAMELGNVEKWLLRVDENGNVTKKLLDAAGKVKTTDF